MSGQLRGRFGGAPLMRRIDVGMQEADRDRLDIFFLLEAGDRVAHLLLVERSSGYRRRTRALLDAEAPPARDQRLVGRDEHIVQRHVDRLDAAPDLDAVAEALGGDHAGLGAAAGEQDVGGERGAVHQDFDLAEEFLDVEFVEARRLLHRIHQADRWIARRRRSLELLQQPRLVHHQAVGEGAADVDTNALVLHFLPLVSTFSDEKPARRDAAGKSSTV